MIVNSKPHSTGHLVQSTWILTEDDILKEAFEVDVFPDLFQHLVFDGEIVKKFSPPSALHFKEAIKHWVRLNLK